MTSQVRSVNKSRFEDGDTTSGSNFADLIDSFISIADTTAQAMASDLTVPKLIATEVSAGEVNASAASITGTLTVSHVSAQTATVSALSVLAAVNAATVSAQSATVSALSVLGKVDADQVSAQSITTSALTVESTATVSGLNVVVLTVASAISFNGVTSAEASSGNGGAVPTTADGFMEFTVGASTRFVPYFKVKS